MTLNSATTEYTPDGHVVAEGAAWTSHTVSWPALWVDVVVHSVSPRNYVGKVRLGQTVVTETAPLVTPADAQTEAEALVEAALARLF